MLLRKVSTLLLSKRFKDVNLPTREPRRISTGLGFGGSVLSNKARKSLKKSLSVEEFANKWNVATCFAYQFTVPRQRLIRQLKAQFMKVEDKSKRFRRGYLEMKDFGKK